MGPGDDPYRVLGVLRGASTEQIKAAHRRLAKRYHPDGAAGDERHFLAVQEAYLLLSDPARRRAWDRAHAPGPVRSGGSGRASVARPRTDGSSRQADEPPSQRRGARVRRPRPATGTRTWSAEHVPWWHDFRPGARGGSADPSAPVSPPSSGPAPTAAGPTASAPSEFDVFDRSSGAAWSSAARRHFRRGTDDLPSRGVWRYRGTQVVTGAEARKVAAEEEEKRAR